MSGKQDHGATTVKTNNKPLADDGSYRATTQGLIGLLDYAIVEGCELRRPLFVFLLRLARLALLEEEGASFQTINFVTAHDDN